MNRLKLNTLGVFAFLASGAIMFGILYALVGPPETPPPARAVPRAAEV
jgi:hypothetical protein